jgi:hypothetical protein
MGHQQLTEDTPKKKKCAFGGGVEQILPVKKRGRGSRVVLIARDI